MIEDDLIKLRDELEKLRKIFDEGFCSRAAADILINGIYSHVDLIEGIRKNQLQVNK